MKWTSLPLAVLVLALAATANAQMFGNGRLINLQDEATVLPSPATEQYSEAVDGGYIAQPAPSLPYGTAPAASPIASGDVAMNHSWASGCCETASDCCGGLWDNYCGSRKLWCHRIKSRVCAPCGRARGGFFGGRGMCGCGDLGCAGACETGGCAAPCESSCGCDWGCHKSLFGNRLSECCSGFLNHCNGLRTRLHSGGPCRTWGSCGFFDCGGSCGGCCGSANWVGCGSSCDRGCGLGHGLGRGFGLRRLHWGRGCGVLSDCLTGCDSGCAAGTYSAPSQYHHDHGSQQVAPELLPADQDYRPATPLPTQETSSPISPWDKSASWDRPLAPLFRNVSY